MDSLRSRLSSAEADHQAALQQVAVVEEQKQQALQDGQEQVSSWWKHELQSLLICIIQKLASQI